jgi:hypothetical protein
MSIAEETRTQAYSYEDVYAYYYLSAVEMVQAGVNAPVTLVDALRRADSYKHWTPAQEAAEAPTFDSLLAWLASPDESDDDLGGRIRLYARGVGVLVSGAEVVLGPECSEGEKIPELPQAQGATVIESYRTVHPNDPRGPHFSVRKYRRVGLRSRR